MCKSEFQEYAFERLKETIKGASDFKQEFLITDDKHVHRWCDIVFVYRGFTYGIEAKSGHADLSTGYGLNMENKAFAFGYIIVPNNRGYVKKANRVLKDRGFEYTGIMVVDEDALIIAKPAMINRKRFNPDDELIRELQTGRVGDPLMFDLIQRKWVDGGG